jgi:hypothetical protein
MPVKPRKKKRRRKGRKRGVYLSKKMGVEMTYRSGWELAYFQYLDSHADVAQFYSESLKIPYVSNQKTKKTRNYIPDLLVIFTDGSKKLVEIKPKSKLTQATNVKKFNAARQWCTSQETEFVIVTEVELKSLGLL